MEEIPDEVIIDMIASFDERKNDEALTYLYKVTKPKISKLVLRYKGDQQQVDDVFHDGLIAFYNLIKAQKIEKGTNVQAYLYSICRNIWSKRVKTKPKEVELDEKFNLFEIDESDYETMVSKEREDLIKQMIANLGEECEKILLLFYFDQMKTKEIVKHMHYANDQVLRNKKSNCLKKLRDIVKSSSFYTSFLRDK